MSIHTKARKQIQRRAIVMEVLSSFLIQSDIDDFSRFSHCMPSGSGASFITRRCCLNQRGLFLKQQKQHLRNIS